jgi:hypothetical protein
LEPRLLRQVGARILEHVAPAVAERAEEAALARQEARAHAGRVLYLSPAGDGRVRLTGWLDALAAATINAALDPLCAPTRDPGGQRSPAQRRADALVEICQLALNTNELPRNGGERPQVVLTVPYDLLRGALSAGTLDTGEQLSPAAVRRLACDAKLLPAVLGSSGQVLDLGRSRRLISGPLRRALVIRDGGCAFPGCDRPARWCEGHHLRAWIDGGLTNLDNSVLVCGFHHRLLHHSDWAVRLGADGLPEFLPPGWIDPLRRPRRNLYHRRL